MTVSAGAGVADDTGPYDLIRRRILSGHWSAGNVLTSSGIAAEQGTSRSPIRDALNRLEYEGLVEKAPGGFLVRVRSAEEILEICDARIALDSAAATKAARQASELDLARLDHLLEQADGADVPARLEIDRQFHHAVRTAGRNATISRLLDGLETQLAAYDSTSTAEPENLAIILDEHRAILAAIRDGDGERAGSTMTAHQTRARDLRIATLARRVDGPS
ncbi:GntR family transcriptional regulator [Pseudonocardia endophytica]|nr:GntR family transcriptional regulator [Pseudonocardia endophytica]